MVVAAVIGVCVVLLALGFLLPRLSQHPQRGVDRVLGIGDRGASHAPGPVGRWLQKSFRKSARAADKSASAGRRGHSKLPL